MGKAGKWSVFLQEGCVYQLCRELKNADVASAAADRADKQEARLHGQSELQSRARRSKLEHSQVQRALTPLHRHLET